MNLKKWMQIAFFNLLIVAAIGVVLRYKIAYSLTFIDQKKLLHAHSHFAFTGWVTQALMALLISRLSIYRGLDLFKRYKWLLTGNLVCAYGMLLSFPIQGYGLVSITFSTGSIIFSYLFATFIWADIKRTGQDKIAFYWFKAAAFFNALSSVGAFSLAYMMATKNINLNGYLVSVYFYLHFQYNGWFTFCILGLLFDQLELQNVNKKHLTYIFRLFSYTCIPAYFLSTLWLPLPYFLYVLVVLVAIMQLIGWVWTIMIIKKQNSFLIQNFTKVPYTIIILSLAAFSIKLLLQLVSTIPAISSLIIGFRPIVVGYLHLVLLGFVSLFILGYAIFSVKLQITNSYKIGAIIFIIGIILNELALMIQGFSAIAFIALTNINEILLLLAIIMFSGLLILNLKKQK